MENKDRLVTCPCCGGNACYEQVLEDGNLTWLCWGCGMTSSTYMGEKSSTTLNILEASPELYKDLKKLDEQGFVWLPANITIPNTGMVFLDGTSKENWKWAAVRAVPLKAEDKKLNETQTHKMDMQNIKHFEHKDFMEACDHIGLFGVAE